MTANQRRPGFRLPWSPDATDPERAPDESGAEPATQRPATADASAGSGLTPADPPASATGDASLAAEAPTVEPAPAAAPDAPTDADAVDATVEPETPAAGAETESAPGDSPQSAPAVATDQPDFLRDLVAAMRRVADEARQAGVAEIRTRADAQVQRIEADTERRRTELTARAETDVAGVGEWAKAEAERIRAEAEGRVAARRAELDQQLAAEQARGAAEAQSLRERVAEYERELSAYHAQLAEINDPAAFAAAAKRMPAPPRLDGEPATTASAPAPVAAKLTPSPATERANGVAPTEPVHPAEEEVLAARLAELDAELPAPGTTGSTLESITTEIVVRGLGSFGAITGFRQSLSGVEGIEAVALSLGQSGEFIFRATHRASLDLAAVITSLEGEGAKIEPRTEGGLLVTLDRSR